MRKAVIVIVLLLVFGLIVITQSQGTPQLARTAKVETIRGDIVELQGKSMFYRDKYSEYPIFHENIYDNPKGKVIEGVMALERSGVYTPEYIRENIKLINVDDMKGKGVTSELANKKGVYFLDTKTGQIISPDLVVQGDEDYIAELIDNQDTGYKILPETIKIETIDKEMAQVNGSFRKGSYIYFYGGGNPVGGKGKLLYARRNETTNEIIDLSEELSDDSIDEILYLQSESGKAAVKVGNTIKVVTLIGR